jgi:hypothetical protein
VGWLWWVFVCCTTELSFGDGWLHVHACRASCAVHDVGCEVVEVLFDFLGGTDVWCCFLPGWQRMD